MKDRRPPRRDTSVPATGQDGKLAFLAHEIRTPLSAIVGIADLLRDTQLSDDQRDMVDLMGRSASNLVEVVNGVLDLAKLEAGKVELEARSFSPAECLEDCLDLLAASAAAKRLELACVIDECVPARIRGDAMRLRQVLTNLVGNALKFTETGEVIVTVTCLPGTDQRCELRFAVADSGPGIAADKVETIFEAFTQAEVSTSRRFGGTGLGLPIARQLVTLMGGRLWVESEPGEGSLFQFTVPAAIVEAAPSSSASLEGPLAGRRMLVIEENATVGGSLAAVASRWGVCTSIVTAPGGVVNMLRAGAFDVVVIDEKMPGLNGRSLATAIHGVPELSRLPLVLMTSLNGHRRAEDQIAGDVTGRFAAYVTKPVRPVRLHDALVRALARRGAAAEPAPSAAAPRSARRSSDDDDGPLEGLRVVVADDDASVRGMLERTLQIAGIEVLAVPDGSEALVAAKDWNADVLLLDGIMPGLDGFEVCRRVKADPRTMLLPVMLITGLDSRADRVRGVEVGADGFMSKPFGRVDLLARVRSLARMKFATDRLDRAEALLVAMARRIEAKDPDMHGHCERLSAYATRLARRLGLDAEAVDALRLGGIIHDIGKVAIPETILLKPTPLDDTEWGIMRDHPAEGERICEGLKSFKHVLPIIRHHHERLDGSGYPDGLAGEGIPMSARLLQLVDIYDVLTTERPYKAALSPNAAFATIESEVNRGWRDRELFAEFRQLVRDEPNMAVGAMNVVN